MFSWFDLFSKTPEETKWDPKTMNVELQQPTSPEAPSTKRDIEKAEIEESTEMKLRGGGGGGACCGICAGLLCFECCC
ncbi:unnamed protein product [Penicillium bialowiezense]